MRASFVARHLEYQKLYYNLFLFPLRFFRQTCNDKSYPHTESLYQEPSNIALVPFLLWCRVEAGVRHPHLYLPSRAGHLVFTWEKSHHRSFPNVYKHRLFTPLLIVMPLTAKFHHLKGP